MGLKYYDHMFQRKEPEAGAEELEHRLLEAIQQRMTENEGQSELDTALSTVRRMLGRITLVQPHIIIHNVETLMEAAQRVCSPDAEFYKSALREIRRFEDDANLGKLVTSLFGSTEDKRVMSAVATWHRASKAEGGADDTGRRAEVRPKQAAQEQQPPPLQQWSPVPGFYPPPQP